MSEIVHTDVKSSAEARGKRLKSLRKMADLSRKALTIKYLISASTIQAWEDGKAGGLTAKGAQRIVAALREEGVYCTVDWLMHGVGQSPYLAERLYLRAAEPMREYASSAIIPHAESITRELLVFRELNYDAIDMVIIDEGMGPYYQVGDTIAGIRCRGNKTIENCVGKDCIVELQNGEVLFRRLRASSNHEHFHLQCINLDTLVKQPYRYDEVLLSAAPVIWHRRVR
jgi:transcriptional regulator with XRE-family HTH domain